MTEPLLLFSPSLHTSLQVLKRSLKPTVKLLSVQAAYKEFIQNLHFIFFKRLNGCVAGFFLSHYSWYVRDHTNQHLSVLSNSKQT